jgi:glycosyltransferase involved in cell wall biosynthesis
MISIVVPVYNEEESLTAFHGELIKEVSKLNSEYEIIYVDDGSIDNSLEIVKKLGEKNKKIRVFSFRRNQGKAEALTLGFQKAMGDVIVTLDADLQDKPSEVKKLLEKQKNNNVDVISGWRKERKDKSRMIFISKIYNYLTGMLFGIRLHDYNCGLKVYTRDAAKSLRLYGGQHRFIPLLVHQQGYTVDEVVVEHEKRKYGKSKYGFSKVWKDLPDMFTMLFLTSYSKRPLHFFGPVGGLLSFSGFIILLYLTFLKVAFNESIGRRPLLLLGVLLVMSGLQIFFTGFIAELVVSITQKNYQQFPLKYSTDGKVLSI